jgi:predicted nucleic acid-binding protein
MGDEGVVPDVAVVDAGPIIHLAQVDSLDLLSMFERVLVPRAVHFELADEGLRSQLEAVGCDLVDGSVDESLASLDSGETAAITRAMAVDDAVLLTDDLGTPRSDGTAKFTDLSG